MVEKEDLILEKLEDLKQRLDWVEQCVHAQAKFTQLKLDYIAKLIHIVGGNFKE